ncbi:hypothetical protein BLS_000039 [Venturia inaequalis]|uniref:SH3 domain-containing protein n=1 Tax=Venturia inaequalis TaxID=5025 RepID=A0A8H3VE69_VENIN|nr:hypothetical protein BLS_000039 [Venturia inaequalis]
MQKMQRKFGVFLPRTADDAQVGMLLADFEAADRMLEALIEGSKAWRDAWSDILNRQSAMLSEYLHIYSDIVTAEGAKDASHALTPRTTLERVNVLKSHYMELKTDMLAEVAMVDKRIIEPAKDAKVSVKQYKKVIKKREDRKLDYERYKSRTEAVEKKSNRSDRENTALAKHRIDLESATAVYQDADEQLRSTLPQMTTATYSILPHLLNAQIMIQNTLLAQLYTTLHNFSQDHGFQSPPPEVEEIIAIFEQDFTSLRLEAESSLKMLTHGKAVHQPMALGNEPKSYSGLAIRSKTTLAIEERRTVKPIRRPSGVGGGGETDSPPMLRIESKPSPGRLTPASTYAERNGSGYFDNNKQLAHRASSNSIATTISNHSIAAKKKPPPPPPPKRITSHQFEYVIALYDFDGQSAGDLSFREGDRIRIVKKTQNQEDWWEGEKGGIQGAFPANYCKKAPLAGR